MTIKIGMLVPNSNFIPFLSRDIPRALELGLAEVDGFDYELHIEPAGYNADQSVLIGKIQDLIVKQQVDLVTAPLNAGLLESLKSYFSGAQVPLIVNTLGEDVVSREAQDPYVLVNSFHFWESSWLAGYWGAATYGKTACTIAGLHDGGYGLGLSFALGLEAQGGTLLRAGVTHRESRVEDPSASLSAMAADRPDFMMGFYSGKEARSFLEAVHRLQVRDRIPLIGLPFTLDDALLNEAGELLLGIQSIHCWRQDTDADRQFTQAFQALTGHPVNCYVLLAYETGQLIAQAVKQIGTGPVNGQLLEALRSAECQGPRGLITFDPKTREVNTTHYLREVAQDEDGRFSNKVIEELETPALFYEQLALARKNLRKQGWLNPYLAA